MANITPREKEVRDLVKGKQAILKQIVNDKAKQSKYSSAIVQIAMNKNLEKVNPESVVNTAFEIVQAGLNPNPLFGQAYVVPFKGVAQLQIGYKGWILLTSRAGWKVRAVSVYDVDDFDIEFAGLSDNIHFTPNYDEREEDDGAWVYKHLKGVIVYAQDRSGTTYSEFVPFRKLEKLRLKSQNQKAGQLSYIWLEWAEEMYKAKALKYVLTRLPIDDSIQEAIAKEDEVYREEEAPKQNKSLENTISKKSEEPEQPCAKYYAQLLQYGVKRNDLRAFCDFCNVRNEEEADVFMSDEELVKQKISDFYVEAE